jgi:hypothetical protein
MCRRPAQGRLRPAARRGKSDDGGRRVGNVLTRAGTHPAAYAGAPTGLALLAHLPQNCWGRWGLPRDPGATDEHPTRARGGPSPDPSPLVPRGEGRREPTLPLVTPRETPPRNLPPQCRRPPTGESARELCQARRSAQLRRPPSRNSPRRPAPRPTSTRRRRPTSRFHSRDFNRRGPGGRVLHPSKRRSAKCPPLSSATTSPAPLARPPAGRGSRP